MDEHLCSKEWVVGSSPIESTMDEAWVSHGYVTHSALEAWRCDDCRAVQEEFARFMSNYGSIQEAIDDLRLQNV